MATKPEDTTNIETVGAEDIKKLLASKGTLLGINKARHIVKELAAELRAKNLFVLPNRIPKEYFLVRYGFKGVKI